MSSINMVLILIYFDNNDTSNKNHLGLNKTHSEEFIYAFYCWSFYIGLSVMILPLVLVNPIPYVTMILSRELDLL